MKLVIKKSTKDKRLMAIFSEKGKKDKIVHFGQKNPKIGTFIDTGRKDLRKAYIARHEVREKKFYNDPQRPATLSRFILWGQSDSLKKNIELYKKKFNLD
tara:strand:+ start:3392 stop:3691 length:300 start_codon:yes stop_codon:yes gene_type:complete